MVVSFPNGGNQAMRSSALCWPSRRAIITLAPHPIAGKCSEGITSKAAVHKYCVSSANMLMHSQGKHVKHCIAALVTLPSAGPLKCINCCSWFLTGQYSADMPGNQQIMLCCQSVVSFGWSTCRVPLHKRGSQQRLTPDVQIGCISCASGDGKFGGPVW